MYWTSLLLPLLAAPACQALPSQDKRATAMSGVSLYAYGVNISGFPVVYDYSTSSLYIAESNTTMAGANSITWSIPSLTQATTTQTVGTVANGTNVGGIWVDTTDDLFNQVLVLSNATLGFATYGKQLVYFNGSSVQSEFWAKEIAQNDGTTVWALHWNSNNEFRSGAVPVALKTLSPA